MPSPRRSVCALLASVALLASALLPSTAAKVAPSIVLADTGSVIDQIGSTVDQVPGCNAEAECRIGGGWKVG